MAKFSLPANSKVRKDGRVFKAPAGAKNVRVFKIYRFDPGLARESAPRQLRGRHGQLRSDGFRRPDQDQERDRSDAELPPLVPRGDLRFVRHEHRRQNGLACISACADVKSDIKIYPLPHLPVIKDLVAGPHAISMRSTPRSSPGCRRARRRRPDRERLQSKEDQEKVDRPSACILCACCSTSCPSYWWNSERYLGPAALLAAYRWIVDSRDEATGERLDELEDPFRLYRCHTIMNCTEACPKDLNPAKAIGEIKQILAHRRH